ncbi:phospholipase/carboxylesterase [Faunimonas pinastri]|uniref:Phospholipase/carboxylesterase n=1 Tax=Faunimonas pinastri TaxID=1855383 RepID=A0A1H9G0E7_9HYPH|nr:dienelactone hydrolase family protein [Faunimonas pinastri]SEQ43590.1 phospholipase/carboxylesterase [Faunimonas pinastri]
MIDGPRLPPSSGGKAKSLVVFLHGYGADGNDLIGLGREWSRMLPDTAFVSPHAPAPCEQSALGRQWFGLTSRDPHDLARGVESARPALDGFLDAELQRHGLDESAVALVGFSQGTMMALHVGPQRKKTLAGIVGYSGLLADPASLALPSISKPPVLLVHGDGDNVVPVGSLLVAAQALGAAGLPVEWHVSRGIAHSIAPDGLSIGGEFLKRVLPE